MSLVFAFTLSSNHKTIPIGTGTAGCDFQIGQVPTLVKIKYRSILNSYIIIQTQNLLLQSDLKKKLNQFSLFFTIR